MTTRPFTITSIHIPDPSRYGDARRTMAMLRGIVIALILCVLAIPFVTEAEASAKAEATAKADSSQPVATHQTATNNITILKQHAAAGSVTAQFSLGDVFQKGQHVKQDMAKAHHYYSLAATQGHMRAHFRLGYLYERGLGVQRNLVIAARHYHIAARQNHPVAQHNLAILFAHGRGVKRNLQTAYGWARMAEINAHQTRSADFHAKLDTLLSRLRAKLSDGQITRAEWHIQLASGIPT